MTRVATEPASTHLPQDTWYAAVASSWQRCHIGERSEYSVERLLSFRDYYQRTSVTTVITICILSPVPSLLTALLLDCTPLQPPSAGWEANYAAWNRLLFAMTFASMGVVYQVRGVIEPSLISIAGAAKIALPTASCCVLTMMVLAATWKFPTPFGYILIIGPYVVFFSLFTVLVIGPRNVFNSSTLREELKSELLIISSQGIVAGCFTFFSAVFNRLSGVQQTAFIFAMPMIKFLTKQNIANAAERFHEYMALIVVFSVDLFNVYYVAICMQSSKSVATTLIIMASDSFHLALALRTIFYRKSEGNGVHNLNESYLEHLPAMLKVIGEKEKRLRGSDQRIRLLSPFPLPLSDESKIFMAVLAKSGRFISDTATNRRYSKKLIKQRKSSGHASGTIGHAWAYSPKQHQIFPANAPASATMSSGINTQRGESISSRAGGSSSLDEKAVQDSLQALFHAEYILLAEYIEFTIPLFYTPYLVAIFHLPVGAFYPHTASIPESKLGQTVGSILIYSAVEFVAFGALLLVLRKKFGCNPLYQLAFVLETHALAIQGHLFLWTITILHLTLQHYGVDFNILTT